MINKPYEFKFSPGDKVTEKTNPYIVYLVLQNYAVFDENGDLEEKYILVKDENGYILTKDESKLISINTKE